MSSEKCVLARKLQICCQGYYRRRRINQDTGAGAGCLPEFMNKKYNLAVPAKHAVSAKTKVEQNFPSPLEKKSAKSVPTLTYGIMAGSAE